jgi:hypothetical protein
MRVLSLVAAVICASCGSVSDSIDAAGIDAPEGNPDAPGCSASETLCGSLCTDTDTDEAHCGDCITACDATEGCLGGTCVDATSSCAVIKALDPSAPDGPYTHEADGTQYYCDMTHGAIMYEELGFGQSSVPHAGFDIVGVADLTDPVIQQAFIWLYNHQGGLRLLAPWTSTNCCFVASTSQTDHLKMGGENIVFPARVGSDDTACNDDPVYADPLYRFSIPAIGVYPPIPMPTNFFQTYPVTSGPYCGSGDNPAAFFLRHP